MEIVFSALNTVVNPELMNLRTREYIRINTTMQKGQKIHVYTGFAQKHVTSILNGNLTNAFSLLDVDSTFIQLSTGTNTLRYDAADGLEQLEVTLYYKPRFLGAS